MMSVTFLFAGCDLFPRNQEAYLNRPVASIEYKDGNIQEITTEQFISAFNSYGATLVQNGTEMEDALKQTLDVLVNRQVMLNEAKQKVTLSDEDKLEVLNDVYDSLISNLEQFEEEVEEEWEIAQTPVEEETEEETSTVYTPYTQTAKVVKVIKSGNTEKIEDLDYVLTDGEVVKGYKIKLIDSETEKEFKNFENLDAVTASIKNQYYNQQSTTTQSRVKKEAFRRYIAVLKSNEKGLKLSTDIDSVFARQAKKTFENVEENKYITSLEEYYKSDNEYSTITVNQVLDKYKAMMMASKFTYENDYSAYQTAMLDSFKDVNYVTDDKFFNVSHILIKFDDAQKAEYDNLKTNLSNGTLMYQEYKNRMDELVAEIKANVMDTTTGEVVSERSISANKVLSNLKADLAKCTTDEQKTQVFKDYLYTYNEDGGIMNAEYAYVIGTEESRMVESFTNTSRELHEKGVYGEISGLVVSEYGVHIIFYMGGIENPIEIDSITDFEIKEADIEKLVSKKLNQFNNKTLFDKVFEQLSVDNYSIFENMNLNVLKKDIKITEYPDVYQNLN